MIPFVLLLLAAASPALIPVNEAAYSKLVASHKGSVLVVNFWATYCAPCRAEMPELLAFGKRNEAKGVRLLIVSADEASDAAKATQFLDSIHVPAPRFIKKAADDDKFINAVDAKWSGALPATFIYDRRGRRVKSFYGAVDFKQLQAAVAKL